jgi:hypothetical protein
LINSAADSKIDKNLIVKLYDAYLLDKRYFKSILCVYLCECKEYDRALKIYPRRNELFGKGTNYLAVNKLTGEDFYYSSRKRQNGKMVPMKNNSRLFLQEERFIKHGLILVDAGKPKRQAIEEARAENPEDTSLILTQANLYLQTKDYETYKTDK